MGVLMTSGTDEPSTKTFESGECGLDRPVLAFGLPRSGTTWIGKLFDSHPGVLYRHEPDSWNRISDIPTFADAGDATRRKLARDYIERVPSMCNTSICGKMPIFDKQWRSPMQQGLYRMAVMSALLVEKLANFRIERIPEADPVGKGARLVWKSIESLGRLPLLLEAIEDVRGVHIVRHPCGFIASVLRGESGGRFRDRTPSSEDYGLFEKILDSETARSLGVDMDTLKSSTPVQRLAWKWLLYNEQAYRGGVDNARYRLIRYEDVCDDPIDRMRELFGFCDLEWHPQTEEFILQTGRRRNDKYYSIYKNPKESANKWRAELDETSVQQIREVVEQGSVGRMYGDRW